jgi:hypothetical protein
MFGLAAITAVAAMAFVGASTASADFNTVLCEEHSALVCPAGKKIELELVHITNLPGTLGRLLPSSGPTVLCLDILGLVEALDLGVAPEPQKFHSHSLSFTNCGTNSAHTNCEVTVEEQSLFDLLKIGLDEGSLEALNGKTRVKCDFVFFELDCVYNATGLLFEVKGGHLTANQTPVTAESGGLCPDESKVDGLAGVLNRLAFVTS